MHLAQANNTVKPQLPVGVLCYVLVMATSSSKISIFLNIARYSYISCTILCCCHYLIHLYLAYLKMNSVKKIVSWAMLLLGTHKEE